VVEGVEVIEGTSLRLDHIDHLDTLDYLGFFSFPDSPPDSPPLRVGFEDGPASAPDEVLELPRAFWTGSPEPPEVPRADRTGAWPDSRPP